MANSSYGWVQPQAQPASPTNTRYAPPQAQQQRNAYASQMQNQQMQNQQAMSDAEGRVQYSPQNQGGAYQQGGIGQNVGGSQYGQLGQMQQGNFRTQNSPSYGLGQQQGSPRMASAAGFNANGFGGDMGGPGNPMPATGGPMGPQNMTPPSMGGVPAPAPWDYQSGSKSGDDFWGWGKSMNNPAAWKHNSAAEDYMNNFFTPMVNAQNSTEAQRFNEFNAGATLREQQRVNTGQMGLAQQGQDLQNKAFGFASGAQFQQGIKQFNAQQGLAQQTQNQNYALGQGQNAYNAQNVANQFSLGQQQNANQLTGMNQNYALGQVANQNTAQNNKWNYGLGQQANANQLTGLNQNYDLGKVANSNQLTGMNQQYDLGKTQNANQLTNYNQQFQLGQGANQNAANANANQLTLGTGQLGFQNRQLDTTNAFNNQQLAQEAALTHEKYQNDLTQARYAAFGRAQAPNARAALSWH